jgi:phytanoyl-CoA hydroxylase
MKNAFNQNMMSTGLLAEGPKEYADTFGRRWLVTSYKAGDVVLHMPYTIHASTLNYDPDNVIRVGTDLRFVDASKPWDTVCAEIDMRRSELMCIAMGS